MMAQTLTQMLLVALYGLFLGLIATFEFGGDIWYLKVVEGTEKR